MFISVFFSAIQFHQFIQLTSSWTNCLNEQYTHKHNNNSQCVRIESDAVWILWISFLFVCIHCSNDRWWKAIWKWFIICLFISNNWNFELLFSAIHLLCKVYLSSWRTFFIANQNTADEWFSFVEFSICPKRFFFPIFFRSTFFFSNLWCTQFSLFFMFFW